MKKAFNYMFNDNCFYKKAGVIYVISLISSVLLGYTEILKQGVGCAVGQTPVVAPCMLIPGLLCSIFGLLITLLEMGYTFSCVQGISSQKDNIVLPFFTFKNNFVKGGKFLLGFRLLLILFSVVLTIATVLLMKFSVPFSELILYVIFTLFLIYFVVFGLAFGWMFANRGNRISTFFRVKEALALINLNSKKYFQYVLLLFGVIVASSVLSFVTELLVSLVVKSDVLSMIIYCVIFSIFAVYLLYVQAYITSRSIEIELA